MESAKIKRILSAVGICLLLLPAVNFMAGQLSPKNTAFETALAECRAKGWQDNDLDQVGLKVSNSVFGSTAAVVLKTKDRNQPKTIGVQLRKRVNLLGWEVVDYNEE